MKLGVLEVELAYVGANDPCDECGALAKLRVDGQPQCLEHAGARLQSDPEAFGALVEAFLRTDKLAKSAVS